MKRASLLGAMALLIAAPGFFAEREAAAQPVKVPVTLFKVPGQTSTFVVGMNDGGAIAGGYTVNFLTHSFVRGADGSITTFDPPGAASSLPSGINEAGTIVGSFFTAAGQGGLYIRSADGTLTTFPYPSEHGSTVVGINDAGGLAGWAANTYGQPHGFVQNADGTVVDFQVGALAGRNRISGTTPTALSGNGWIAGSAYGSDTDPLGIGFVRNPDGKIETFSVAPNDDVFAYAVNQSGAVTGFHVAAGSVEPFLRAPDGNITTFAYSPCRLTPDGIDSKGQIVGECAAQMNGKPEIDSGFVRSKNGKIRTFRVHGQQTTVLGITPSGMVFGNVLRKSGTEYGFFGTP